MRPPSFHPRDVEDCLALVTRDLGELAGTLGPVSLRRVLPGASRDDAEWLVGLPAGISRWVLSAAGSETALDSTSLAILTADIASYLQDAVADASGRPWPEIPGVGVLDSGVLAGAAWWLKAGAPFVRIGELAAFDE